MTFPPGFNARPLAPTINILDHKWRLKYRYEHPQLASDPVQDFTIESWSISMGINSDAGRARLLIDDHMADLTDEHGTSLIQTGDLLQIYLGKSASALHVWFTGIITEPVVERPGYKQQKIAIQAYGYGTRLGSTYVDIDHEQRKNEVSGEYDPTDNDANISNIVHRIMTDESVIIQPPPDPNLTYDGIDDVTIKLANFVKINKSQAICLAELANAANAVYGVDANLDFYFRDDDQASGWTITNGDTDRLDPAKLFIPRNKRYGYVDSSIRKAYTSMIGQGLTQVTDVLPDTGGTTDQRLNQYELIGFEVPYLGKVETLQIWIKRTGTVTEPLQWKIIEELSDRLDGNEPAIKSGTIPLSTLQALDADGTWVSFELNLENQTGNRNRVIFIDEINGLDIPHGPGSSATDIWRIFFRGQPTSSDLNATMRCRIRAEQTALLVGQNTTLKHRQLAKQSLQSLNALETTATATTVIEGLMKNSGNILRSYTGMAVSAPDTPPPLGKTVRIIDEHNGLDSAALMIGLDIGGDIRGNLTAIDMTLEAQERA